MDDLRLAWRAATNSGRLCGLALLSWSLGGGIALLAAIAVLLALEPSL